MVDENMTLPLDVNIIGKRILASIIDLIIIFIVFMIAVHFFGTTSYADGSVSANLEGLPALIFFVLLFAYFIVLEWKKGGTVGKLLLGIKVTTLEGNPIGLSASVKRNLLRLVDGFPYFIPNLVGLIVLSTNSKKQRIGDKVAQTLVVKK